MPKIASSTYFKSYLGLNYYQENSFTLAKERSNAQEGAQVVQTLSGLKYDDGSSVFSTRWLVKKYLGLTDADLNLNKKYIEGDILKSLKKKPRDQSQGNDMQPNEGFGGGFGMEESEFNEPMTQESSEAQEPQESTNEVF